MKKLLLIICIVCIGSAFYAQDRCERLGKDYTYLETLLGRTNDTTQMVKYLGMMEDLYYLNVQYDCGMPQTVLQSIVERKRSLLGVPKHVVVDKYVFAESYYEINYDDDALIIDLIAGKKRNKLEVLSVPDWLEEYNEDGDQGSLDFFVDENVSLDSRTGIVSVRDGNKVYDCQIVQLGSKFRCEMTKSITFGGTGGGNHVDIESNDTVYTYYCPLWLTLDKDKSGYVVRCSANPNLTARVDSIMFMFGCGQLQYVRVNQEAGGIRAEATKKEITFEAMGGKDVVVVNSNIESWSVQTTCDWIDVFKSNGVIGVICKMNYSGVSRRGGMKIINESSGETLDYIEVFQSAADRQ